ncbi:MAG: UDP-2,3-diacylglucosamine diphosphatase [Burkholderiaceae bacterium]|nr:UDP-2,3-diacylglucosamine diphosphatase [Burkholderiaceae bacterium]
MKNKIVLTGQVWVASDIHLGPQAPATVHAFGRFLDQASQQADALILLGDIFDAWIGDDFALQAPPAWLSDILAKLQQLATKIPLFLGRGNRDFLIGPALARHIGAQLLPDKFILQADCGPLLLSHGDEYCTADKNYQRFRTVVRCPVIQGMFLSLSLNTRRRIAEWARSRSRQANQTKPAQIMDVSTKAIEQAWTDSGIDVLVHGHTHRPAVHSSLHLGRECTRIVLPDWDYDHGAPVRSGWLSISASGPELRLHTFTPSDDITSADNTAASDV